MSKHPSNSKTVAGHLAAIVESSDDVIISKSLQGIIQTWNKAAERVFGYTAAEVIGKPIGILIPPGRENEESQILARIRAGERIEHYETVRRRKDGTLITVSLTVSPIRDEDGNLVGASKIARDVTQQRLAENTLRQVQARLRMVIDSAPIVMFALDRNGTITLLEGRTLATLGLEVNELIGQPVTELSGDARQWIAANVKQALAGEERTYTAKVGERWLETRLVPLRDENSEIFGVSGVALDVTEQRHAQEEIFRSSKLESIGVLAGGIAHDFNNILTAIVGNLALARLKLSDTDEAARYVAESEKAAMRARGLTQQLLTFAKGGAPVKRTIDLAGMLEPTVEFALGGSNVRAEILVVRDLWRIEADEGQINQVINNLIINAQQAMLEGGVVEVSARNVRLRQDEPPLPAGEYVRIDFRDEGPGIDPQYLPKIFDPFFTTKAQGTGLGLTSVYRIVAQHGGHIRVESHLGVGTTFHVYLPRTHNGDTSIEGPIAIQPGRGKVLFMDDDEAICDLAGEMLKVLGYEVSLAANGDQALTHYREALEAHKPFDVVILDLTVRGGLGGMETLRALRAIDPDVTAIVSSGYSSNAVLADYGKHGFVAQVAKPYTPETLSAVLSDVMQTRKNRRSSVTSIRK